MEPIDYTSPNLDGDFKTLYKVLQKIDQEDASKDLDLGDVTTTIPTTPSEPVSGDEPVVVHSTPPKEDNKDLYTKLVNAVIGDDVDAFKDVLQIVNSRKLKLTKSDFRDPGNNATLLHLALMGEHFKVADYLMKTQDINFLMQECNVMVNNIHTNKTCLHILAEKDNLKYTKKFLQQLPVGKTMQQFLDKTVLTEMEGQRPRQLAVIHIASLRGNIDLINFYVSMGVDVNSKNNKNDTPVLLATRGNHIEAVKVLMQLGADIHCQNDKASSPLYWAVRYGFTELVQVLIKGGADVNQRRSLGLVAPIVLAAALGYVKILEILIQEDADINTKITGDQTPLHLACASGHVAVINILVHHGARVDAPDSEGNTPLMYAAKNNRLSAVCAIIQSGGNFEAKNKLGQTVWDFAVNNPKDELMRALVILYRKRSRMTSKKFIMPAGRTPLHIAALIGDVSKIKTLFGVGVDPNTTDQTGSTYFQVAARNNCFYVVKEFLEDVNVNHQNLDGETALHLAVKNGHMEVVELLIKKAKLEIRDNAGNTVLHTAVRSSLTSVELIQLVVKVMISTANWSIVNAEDERGNTALHLACRKGRSEVIPSLASLNPMKTNSEGDTPLHVAAKLGVRATLEALMKVFNRPGKGLQINATNEVGEAALHICAKQGDGAPVKILIENGADLTVQNADGNTLIHELALCSVVDSAQKENHLGVYRTITEEATRWWCVSTDRHIPDEDSDIYMKFKRTAILLLTSGIYNKRGMDALTFAISVGAKDIVSAILNTHDVYCFQTHKEMVFDVTSLAPETLPIEARKSSKKTSGPFNLAMVGVLEESEPEVASVKHLQISCLDVIVEMHDEVQASAVLDLCPIRQMIDNFWTVYQWVYGFLMVLHILYMALFTVFSIPLLETFYNNAENGVTNVRPATAPVGFLLIWPVLILLFQFYHMSIRLHHYFKKKHSTSESETQEDRNIIRRFFSFIANAFSKFIHGVFGQLSSLTSVAFGGLIIVWYVMYCLASSDQIYIVPLILILGWMLTIAFNKGFQDLHAFSIMMKYIIMRDMTRFLFMYIFVLLGFAFALMALFQHSPGLSGNRWDSIFSTFNIMLGQDDSIFSDEFYSDYTSSGGSVLYVQLVYMAYVTLATVILLNLLIAMMSDTYTQVKAREGTTWRVGSVRLALGLERSFPFLKKFLRSTGVMEKSFYWDEEAQRWMMSVPLSQLDETKSVEVNETLLSIRKLESRVAVLQANQDYLVRQLGVSEGTPKGNWSTVHKASTVVSNMVRPSTAKGLSNQKSGLKDNPLVRSQIKRK